jgi:hypothetical protein
MGNFTIDKLSERVEQLAQECAGLRKQARRWKRLGGLALIGTVALVAAGADLGGAMKTLEAERLVIKGKDGKVYAELRTLQNKFFPSEAAHLLFYDGKGNMRANFGLGTPDHRPHLRFIDAEGEVKDRMVMSMSPEGRTHISFTAKSGATGITIGSDEDASAVTLYGPDENGRGRQNEGGLLVTKEGKARVTVDGAGARR